MRIIMRVKPDYAAVIKEAQDKELIGEWDKYCFCSVKPEQVTNAGPVLISKVYKYDVLFVVNENEAKIYDIDKKTGALVGSSITIKREDMNFLWTSWLFGWDISLNAKEVGYVKSFSPSKKFHGFRQDNLVMDVVNFIKAKYIIPYNEAKKAGKLKK